jgi:16S rRNA (cytosine1402-N4)-methyltransferase
LGGDFLSTENDEDLPELESSGRPHISVLPNEVLATLALKPGVSVIDCTLGAGGHSELFLKAVAPGGRVIGMDVDPVALGIAEKRLRPQAEALGVTLEFVRSNFRNIESVCANLPPGPPVMGILADLGVSSMQLDDPSRGFSFRADAPLDMRMDPTLPHSAADLLKIWTEEQIADCLYQWGGERHARRIAKYIMGNREQRNDPVVTTGQLERLVRIALKVRGHQRIHPATRTFQALRIAVNQEPEALAEFLAAAPEQLAPGGAVAVISFHSGEDRLVKQAFKGLSQSGRFQLTSKSVVCPSDPECAENPRARSAKLRGLRRTAE